MQNTTSKVVQRIASIRMRAEFGREFSGRECGKQSARVADGEKSRSFFHNLIRFRGVRQASRARPALVARIQRRVGLRHAAQGDDGKMLSPRDVRHVKFDDHTRLAVQQVRGAGHPANEPASVPADRCVGGCCESSCSLPSLIDKRID